jgi:hypothetical protein
MKILKFIGFPVFLILLNCSLDAQFIDTPSAKQVIENGSIGDIILGEKNKKDQLKDTPVLLHQKDSVCIKDVSRPPKKLRGRQNRNN